MWDLWNQNISLGMLRESGYTLCVGAVWKGSKGFIFLRHDEPDFLENLWMLLDTADAVVTFNGDRFDIPIMNKDLLLGGYTPPSPYHSIDLYKTVKRRFKFPSNKLAYVTGALGLQTKLDSGGFAVWAGCMSGDEKSWDQMRRYNKRDVLIMEPLHDKLIPWMQPYPNQMLYNQGCPRCTNGDLAPQGFRYTATGKYQRYRCNNCGGWSSDTTRIDGVGHVGIS